MKKIFLVVFGIILIFIGVLGVNYSIKASRAQALYEQSRYSEKGNTLSPELVYANYIHATKLYPYNFYFSAYAGEKFFYNLSQYSDDELAQKLNIISDIANHGIEINPYNEQLIYLHMRMLEKDSPRAALEYWQNFVNWYFWKDYNHSVLAELYAKVGMYEKAMNELRYLQKNPKLLDHTKHLIDDAWLLEMKKKAPAAQ
jgi:hypothetical protein